MKNKTQKRSITLRYLPKKLTKKDRKKQLNMILKSRMYRRINQLNLVIYQMQNEFTI